MHSSPTTGDSRCILSTSYYEVQQRFFASWKGLERLAAAGEVAVQSELIGTEIQAPEIGD